jgi:hypothetical protein
LAAQRWRGRSRLAHSNLENFLELVWHAGNEVEEAKYLAALRQGFNDLGYVEGKTYVLASFDHLVDAGEDKYSRTFASS